MEFLSQMTHYILGFGAAIFVPMIMLVVGLVVRMKLSDAVRSALLLGVAFTGMGVLINFLCAAITPAAQMLAQKTGIELTVIDLGWPAASTMSWAWPLGILLFPLQIGINIAMITFKKTNTLNVDLWNVWNKLFTAVMTYYACLTAGLSTTWATAAAFIAAAIQVVLELKIADAWQPTVQTITKIPKVTVPHCMTLTAAPLLSIEKLLEKIDIIQNNSLDAVWLKEKLGIFGENAPMGFIIGGVLGLVAYGDLQKALTLGIEAACAMQLFPMVSKLFMDALYPISEQVGNYMKKHFSGRDIYIGMDWSVVAGSNELWVVTILLIPVEIVLAIVLAPLGNKVLPFAGIMNVCVVLPALFLTGGNLVKMLIMGVIATPLYLFVSTAFAPYMTRLAQEWAPAALDGIATNTYVTWSTLECPDFRWSVAHALAQNPAGIAAFVVFIVLFVWLMKTMKKRNKVLEEKLCCADACKADCES